MKYFKIIASELLHVFGALWLIVEAVSFFMNEQAAEKVKSYWWLFLVVGIVISVIRLIPKRRFNFKLTGRDIIIELVIGDIFKEKGPVIVGSNTDFITSNDIISPNSVQGLFTSKYFTDRRVIDEQIKSQVGDGPHPIGTTVTIRASNKIAYFVAIAEMNDAGVAKSNLENIRLALGELWNYLSSKGEKDILNVPILGSGYSRVSSPREMLAKEIIKSFVASTIDHTFCDGLRLVIHKKDISKYNMDIENLIQFIEYTCKHSLIGIGSAESMIGTAEP